jgi:hypothetical protein
MSEKKAPNQSIVKNICFLSASDQARGNQLRLYPIDADHSASPFPDLTIRRYQTQCQQDGRDDADNQNTSLVPTIIQWLKHQIS